MTPASVGFQCPDCVKSGAKSVRQGRTVFGGAVSRDTASTAAILIGLNVAVWVLVNAASVWLDRLALTPQTQVFADGQGGLVMVRGVADGQAGAGGAWWQLLTSTFTHQSLLHILFNMLALWQFMQPLEQVLGRTRVLAVYFIAGLAGSAVVMWAGEPYAQTIGASGAVFGLVGAHVVVAKRVGAELSGIGAMVIYLFLFTFVVPGISWQGHVGGFVGGMAAAGVIAYAPTKQRTAVQVGGLLILFVAICVAIALRVAQLQS